MKLFILAIFIMSVILPLNALAQTKTSTPSSAPVKISATLKPEDEKLKNKIRQNELLKEKIATKVAKIRDKEKGAFLGTVKSVGNSNAVLTVPAGETEFTFSEDTLYFQINDNQKKEWPEAKLKTGDYISVFGYYNESRDLFSAKYIFLQEKLIRIVGKIADIDKNKYTLNVRARDGEKTIDFETYTVTSQLVTGRGSQKGGFSKFAIGDTVSIIGTINPKADERYSALRILHLPVSVSPTPAVSTPAATITPKITS